MELQEERLGSSLLHPQHLEPHRLEDAQQIFVGEKANKRDRMLPPPETLCGHSAQGMQVASSAPTALTDSFTPTPPGPLSGSVNTTTSPHTDAL